MPISPTTAPFRAAFGLATALLILGTGACRDTRSADQPPPSTATSASAPTAVQSASPSSGGTTAALYANKRDVCSTLDHARLTRALGVDAGNLGKPRFSDTRASSHATCDHQYGAAGMRSLLSLEVMTSKVGSVQAFYEGMRGAQQRSTAVTDVPGVGQQAAVYTDPTTGPRLLAYDGNLYLSIALIPVNSAATEQLDTRELLVACAEHVLGALRQH